MSKLSITDMTVLETLAEGRMEPDEIGERTSIPRNRLHQCLNRLARNHDVFRSEERTPCTRNCEDCEGDMACSNSKLHIFWSITDAGREQLAK